MELPLEIWYQVGMFLDIYCSNNLMQVNAAIFNCFANNTFWKEKTKQLIWNLYHVHFIEEEIHPTYTWHRYCLALSSWYQKVSESNIRKSMLHFFEFGNLPFDVILIQSRKLEISRELIFIGGWNNFLPIRLKYYLDYDRGSNIFPLFYSIAFPKTAQVKEDENSIFFLEEEKKIDFYNFLWKDSTIVDDQQKKQWISNLYAVLSWDDFIT